MTIPKKIVAVIMEHQDDNALVDFVHNLEFFFPEATLVLYNSGEISSLGKKLNILHFPNPNKYLYAKITPFFFEIFEWLINSKIDFDYFINLETDVLFIRKEFHQFILNSMLECDYMAPNFQKFTSAKSEWRPIRSLRPELPYWYDLLQMHHTNQCFSPGQVFSRTFIQKLLSHNKYGAIKDMLKTNQSFTLQEVLFPTLVDFLEVNGKAYPPITKSFNRYRPYQAISSVKKALNSKEVFFVHPVRRNLNDPTRQFIRNLKTQ